MTGDQDELGGEPERVLKTVELSHTLQKSVVDIDDGRTIYFFRIDMINKGYYILVNIINMN